MANPNLKNLASVYGLTSGMSSIPTTASGIVTCGSNEVLKINNLYISNIDGTNTATITADLYNGSSVLGYYIKELSIGAGGSVNIITNETSVYLNENQSLRLTASASGDLSAIISYERIA